MKRFLPITILALLCTSVVVQTMMARDAVSTHPSPYINKVYEYKPAPGQFINTLPQYETGDDETSMLRKIEAKIVDTIGTTNYICLGAWGGYVTFGFDHPIINIEGQADFEVGGNYISSQKTFNPLTEKNPTGTFSRDTLQKGSSEPGIIYVSRDDNGNGIPDDTWYEIAGSEYPYSTQTYSITYYRPATDKEDILGIDIFGDTLYVKRNNFHLQAYYPQWTEANTITFEGSLMPNNLLAGTLNLITLDYGYADNAANGSAQNGIDISWAVDTNGNPANLTSIDFVKVQTGVSQDGGIMGETSTEVTGARDLHPEATALYTIDANVTSQKMLKNGQLIIRRGDTYFDIFGNIINIK